MFSFEAQHVVLSDDGRWGRRLSQREGGWIAFEWATCNTILQSIIQDLKINSISKLMIILPVISPKKADNIILRSWQEHAFWASPHSCRKKKGLKPKKVENY